MMNNLLYCFAKRTFQKNYLLPIAFLLLSHVALAHLGKITGTVSDASTGQPLTGVAVVLSGQDKGTITNELGQYQFSNLPAATYLLEFNGLGYQSQILTANVQDDQTTFLQTQLITAPIDLGAVTVSALRLNDQQIISSVDIRLRPVTNSQEILRMVPGLFIGQHAGGGKAEQLFLRGFDLDHGTDIRLSVDGMPVNMVSHAHGQGYADLHFVIPEMVQSLNFGKGPYSTDQGNLTTAGWVNFQTKTTLDRNFVKAEVGQYDTYRVVGAVNLLGKNEGKDKSSRQSAYVASEYQYSNSYFENPQYFNRFNLLSKYHGHLSPSTTLTLTASTFWSKWNHSGQIPDRAVDSGQTGFFGSIDPTEGGETSRTNLNAQLVTITSRKDEIRQQVYYSRNAFELYSNFTFFLNDSINGDQIRQKEKRNLFGYSGSITRYHQLSGKNLTTTLGVQYRQDLTDSTELSHTRNRSETLERYQLGNINELNASLYLDEVLYLSSRLTVNAGLRLDVFRQSYEDLLRTPATTPRTNTAIVSPKINLNYTFSPRLQFYAKAGKGFHSNDSRVVSAGASIQGVRQALPPAWGGDLGAVWKPLPRLLVSTALWTLHMAQEFVYVGDEGVVEPGGRTRREGADLSLRYQLTDHLFADLDMNATRPRFVDEEAGQNFVPLAPVLTSIGGLSYQAERGFNGSLRYRYIGDRPANEDNSLVAKGYFVSDLQLNYTLPRQQFGLSIQNLLNTRWKETQFATESRLRQETAPVEEIHFTPGTPFFARLTWTWFW